MENIHLACKTTLKSTQPRLVVFSGEGGTQ